MNGKRSVSENQEIRTFPIMTLAAFQLLSFGIFGALLDSRTMTAAVTFTTAAGGEPNDFNSVRLPYMRINKTYYLLSDRRSIHNRSLFYSFQGGDTVNDTSSAW